MLDPQTCPTRADTTPQLACRCWERFGWIDCRQCRCNPWDQLGHERYLVFWIDYCNLFQRPGDQGSSYFSIMHQGVKRLDLRSYMNSRPCETLQLAQVDLLLQQNMPGLQDKKVQHPSQSECHFIMFSNSFWMFLKQMLMKFSWNGALLGCCPCQRVWIAVSLEIKVPRLVEPRFFPFWTPCQLEIFVCPSTTSFPFNFQFSPGTIGHHWPFKP